MTQVSTCGAHQQRSHRRPTQQKCWMNIIYPKTEVWLVDTVYCSLYLTFAVPAKLDSLLLREPRVNQGVPKITPTKPQRKPTPTNIPTITKQHVDKWVHRYNYCAWFFCLLIFIKLTSTPSPYSLKGVRSGFFISISLAPLYLSVFLFSFALYILVCSPLSCSSLFVFFDYLISV